MQCFVLTNKILNALLLQPYNVLISQLLDSTKLTTEFVYSICIVIMSKTMKTSCKERKRIEPTGSQNGYNNSVYLLVTLQTLHKCFVIIVHYQSINFSFCGCSYYSPATRNYFIFTMQPQLPGFRQTQLFRQYNEHY